MEGARAALGGGVGKLCFEDPCARIQRGVAMHLASQSSSRFLAPSCSCLSKRVTAAEAREPVFAQRAEMGAHTASRGSDLIFLSCASPLWGTWLHLFSLYPWMSIAMQSVLSLPFKINTFIHYTHSLTF